MVLPIEDPVEEIQVIQDCIHTDPPAQPHLTDSIIADLIWSTRVEHNIIDVDCTTVGHGGYSQGVAMSSSSWEEITLAPESDTIGEPWTGQCELQPTDFGDRVLMIKF